MAGGAGVRFWPMSRDSKPKQFINILGLDKSLIQMTYERFKIIIPAENIFVVTSDKYASLVQEQIPSLKEYQIVSEPARRNTAPCIAYATHKIMALNVDANIVVAPSDHIIINEIDFSKIIKQSLRAVEKDDILMTLGITPSRPDTGYGYIQYVFDSKYKKNKNIRKVKTFTEKPQYEMAVEFLKCGEFLWNSGIFIWSGKSILKAFEKHLYDVYELFQKGNNLYNTNDEKQFIQDIYPICKSISIDYGIMEKAENVYVYISNFGWSDIGTWGSLHDLKEKDKNNNAIYGKNVMLYNVTNSIVNMPKDKLAVIHGLDDYIIVEDNNILLICKKSDEQTIRQFVNDVHAEKGDKYI